MISPIGKYIPITPSRRLIWLPFLMILVLLPVGVGEASEGLTGEMAGFNYLLGGTWRCAPAPSPHGEKASDATPSEAVFDVAPGNVMHGQTRKGNATSQDYFGYQPAAKVFWHASIDNTGSTYYGVSRDGTKYFGYRWSTLLLRRIRANITYSKVNASRFDAIFSIGENTSAARLKAECSRR
jgi:hypothetical protein